MRIEKSNILLLIGPSGSGKSHLVRSLASFLDVPLVIGDATSLTEAGYVGDDVESLLSRLLAAANNDVAVAQRGIVYIDEIDKLRTSGTHGKDMRLGEDQEWETGMLPPLRWNIMRPYERRSTV